MLNREKDVPYCGVRPEVIANASPTLDPDVLAHHYHWMKERHWIWYQKEVQELPAPWTEDPILKNHKFTNTRRENDRQSKYLINGICNNDRLSMADKIMNCILFRMFNKYDIFVILGGPWTLEEIREWDTESFRATLKQIDDDCGGDGKFFTNAFNTGGLKQSTAFPEQEPNMKEVRYGGHIVTLRQGDKVQELDYKIARDIAKADLDATIDGWERYMPLRILRYVKYMATQRMDIIENILTAEDQKAAYKALFEIRGFSNFLAYQVWVDLTYCPEYDFSENEFTISGPGCIKGVDHLFTDRDGMTHDECIFWLRDNQHEVYRKFGYEPEDFWVGCKPEDQCMNVMQLENSFCELGKYLRCIAALENGEKPRTRVKYDGAGGQEIVKNPKTRRLW